MSEPKVTERISVTVSVEYQKSDTLNFEILGDRFSPTLVESAQRLAEEKAGAACRYTGHRNTPESIIINFNAAKGGSS